MPSTIFSNGSRIVSTWLNEVNTVVFRTAASWLSTLGLSGSGGASNVGFLQEGTGAVMRTVAGKLYDVVSAKDFGAVGDGVTDDTTALQAALDAGLGPVVCPPGVYIVTGELVIPDRGGIIGAGAHWKRRTGYLYDGTGQTVFKYTGAGGSNTCVIRASNKAVGTKGTDFDASGDGVTDDLTDIALQDFHVDANGLAEIGVYVYRAGNQSRIGNITAEKAKKFNHVHLGCYAAHFGVFGADMCEEHGVAIGWDIFGWSSVEATNFAYSASFLLANNGTAGTYVAGTGTDLDGSGGKFSVGRGSKVYITSESNDGRACILSQYNIGSGTSGPTDYVLKYVEGNADGPYVDYRDGMDAIRLCEGFIHPGNGSTLLPQNIKIDGKNNAGTVTANSGPADQERWLTLYRLFGDLSGVGAEIQSNTYKYKLLECEPGLTFSDKRPGTFQFNATLAGAVTAGTQTYTARICHCSRVGNIVHVSGRVTLSSLDAATAGQILISGLPYRMASSSNHFGNVVISIWANLATAAIRVDGTIDSGESAIKMRIMTAAATSNATALVPADLTASSLIQFTATYITDDA